MNITISPVKLQNNSNIKSKTGIYSKMTSYSKVMQNDQFVKTVSTQNVDSSNPKNVSFKGYFEDYEYEKLEKDDPIEWAKRWDYNKRKEYYDKKYESEIEYKLTSIGNRKIRAKWDMAFAQEQAKVTNILQTISQVQEKLDKADSRMDEAQKQAKINEVLSEQIRATQRIKDRISSRVDNKDKNMDNTIAGYAFQKDVIRENFLYPILLEKEYIEAYNAMLENSTDYTAEEIEEARERAYSQPVAPCLFLYGCFGTGKTALSQASATEAGCEWNEYTETDGDFDTFLTEIQKKSRERYLQTGQRTVAIINEVSDHINNSAEFDEPVDAEEEKEFRKMKKRISRMRGILEHCYKLPKEDGTGGSALTFMFTTNFPQRLTDIGLIEKKQRISAVIAVEPATGEDLKEVLKLHIKRVMPEESSFDLDNYDFSAMMEKLDISDKKGCYQNGQIQGAADEIRTAYDKDPSKSFKEHFEDMILNDKAPSLAKRGISPRVYSKYYNDLEEVGGYKKNGN